MVARINSKIVPKKTTNLLTVGVLDIYGFEIFEDNSFEQVWEWRWIGAAVVWKGLAGSGSGLTAYLHVSVVATTARPFSTPPPTPAYFPLLVAQFCINYANEKLQQLFINNVLRQEQVRDRLPIGGGEEGG